MTLALRVFVGFEDTQFTQAEKAGVLTNMWLAYSN